MSLKSDTYYQLGSGEVLKVDYLSASGKRVYCKTVLGEHIDRRLKGFEGAVEVDFRPSIPELWALSEQRKPKSGRANVFLRLIFFFEKLIEFDYLIIDTLGYYHNEPRLDKNNIGLSLASGFAQLIGMAFPENHGGSNESKRLRADFLAWANHPSDDNRERLFTHPLTARIDRECHVTGDRFEWALDGKTFRPTKRCLTAREVRQRNNMLAMELKTLRANPNAMQSRVDFLAEAVESEFGWVRHFDFLNMTRALPFTKVYGADGKLPKITVEIDVPTGKLLFANTLFHHLFPSPDDQREEDTFDPCNRKGRAERSEFYAKKAQAFFVHVGNTSPDVWQSKKDAGTLRVGYAAEDEPRPNQWTAAAAKRSWIKRGHVITQLWAFTAIDASRLDTLPADNHFIVNVPPGRYRLISHYEDHGRDTGVFCEISRVGDVSSNP